jgi:hypothetical protein
MSEKIYFNGVNGKKTMYGTRISINVEKFVAELMKYKNEAGYCNININDRKSPDKYGNNVYVTLDTWKPDASKKTSQPAPAAKVVDDLDLPF